MKNVLWQNLAPLKQILKLTLQLSLITPNIGHYTDDVDYEVCRQRAINTIRNYNWIRSLSGLVNRTCCFATQPKRDLQRDSITSSRLTRIHHEHFHFNQTNDGVDRSLIKQAKQFIYWHKKMFDFWTLRRNTKVVWQHQPNQQAPVTTNAYRPLTVTQPEKEAL